MREVRVSIVNTQRAALHEPDGGVVLSKACAGIECVGRDNPDIILLSETFANSTETLTVSGYAEAAQTVPGPISEELSMLARKYQTYVAFGLIRKDGDRIYNSLVLLDRDGEYVWDYDKVTPMVPEMIDCGITPGKTPHPYECDFGRVGGAICFDINFQELAELYCRRDVELVLFSSAFPGGRLLDIWAIRYGFNVLCSTWYDRNRIIDCTGATIGQTSDVLPNTTAVLNLNRKVVHMDCNLDKIDAMRTKYSGDVFIEDLRDEATCVITSLKKGLEVSALIREFDIETLPAYFDRSRQTRKEHGGMKIPEWF